MCCEVASAMSRPLQRILEINEELAGLLDEEFEQVLRVIPPAFDAGVEWYDAGVAIIESPNMAKIERFLGNEMAVIEGISQQWQVMKLVKLKRPAMLTKKFCFFAYRANLRDQDQVVKYIPAEYWHDLRYANMMMKESPMCLRCCPIPIRNALRHIHRCEWLLFEDELPS